LIAGFEPRPRFAMNARASATASALISTPTIVPDAPTRAESRPRHPRGDGDVVDELALLLDLKDVYWANDGRKSVDVAVTVIAAGALIVAGPPLWPHARRALTSL
jgi:hypothetical protein